LIIRGHDDCMSFYELFLNSFGSLYGNSSDTPDCGDVPLLVSRSLGPNKNMALHHLSSCILHDQREGSKTSQQQQHHQLSSIELHGPIFPCSVRDLLCASASHFSLHKNRSRHSKSANTENDNRDDAVDETILGSHYFMTHLRDHTGEDASNYTTNQARTIMGKMGSAGALLFNGLDQSRNHLDSKDTTGEECKNGEVTTMTVWDVNRPFSIAYKNSRVEDVCSSPTGLS